MRLPKLVARLVASDTYHFFVVEEPEDFADDAFDGFDVVLVGVEGFAEELVDALFGVSEIRGDGCQRRGCG